MNHAARIDRLRARFDALGPSGGVDALLVTTPSNRRWISGFTGSAGVALVTRTEARFATDSRYWEQVGRECPDFDLVRVAGANTGVAPAILEGLAGVRVGFEPADVTVAALEGWTHAIAELPASSRPTLVPAPRAIEDLRMVKEPEELDALTRAVHLGDAAFVHASERAEPGMTERQLGWLVQEYALQAYRAVDCAGLARVDFFVQPPGDVHIIEVNTLPGFTPISMYPRLWQHAGISYPALITRLAELAIERHTEAKRYA